MTLRRPPGGSGEVAMEASQTEDTFLGDVAKIGVRVKHLRKSKMLTIADLAVYTGLSVGYLSNVERNQTSPTIVNLSKICRALGVPLEEVLRVEGEERLLVRAKDRLALEYPTLKMTIERIGFTPEQDSYEVITFEPGDADVATSRHPYAEACFVMEGTLTVSEEGSMPVELEAGDALYIKANTTFQLANHGATRCVSFWHHRNAS